MLLFILGDTGSLFIGGLLGALPLSLNVGVTGHLIQTNWYVLVAVAQLMFLKYMKIKLEPLLKMAVIKIYE